MIVRMPGRRPYLAPWPDYPADPAIATIEAIEDGVLLMPYDWTTERGCLAYDARQSSRGAYGKLIGQRYVVDRVLRVEAVPVLRRLYPFLGPFLSTIMRD